MRVCPPAVDATEGAADCAEAVWSSLEMDLASSSEALDALWLGLAID